MLSSLRLRTRSTRRFSSYAGPTHPRKRRIAIASSIASIGFATVYATREGIREETEKKPVPLSSLLRSYMVYSMCSMPLLIDWSPAILSTLSSIPGVRQVTEFVVRHTFFSQFVGGDTAQKCTPLIRQLRSEDKGCLFAYSIEVDESKAAGNAILKADRIPIHKRVVEEMIRSIDIAADFEDDLKSPSRRRKTWVAVKMTALVPDAQSLVNLSKHILRSRAQLPIHVPFPGSPTTADLEVLDSSVIPWELTEADVSALKELYEDLTRICSRAKERQVKIIVDAEYSWYQPAIDALTLSLTRRFNKLETGNTSGIQPLIYATHQAYLRRAPLHLKQSFIDAQRGNYALGIKLVRGAYHEHEVAACLVSPSESPSISNERDPPVYVTKIETDECYNSSAKVLVQYLKQDIEVLAEVPHIGILFGTHNLSSCDEILDDLTKQALVVRNADGVVAIGDEVLERLTFGQLLGMKDDLTEYLVKNTRASNPVVLKYVPYGSLSEVMPYLSRRAIENKSILGNGAAQEERRRVGKEIQRRIFGV